MENRNLKPISDSPLNIAAAILFFIAALVHMVYSIQNLTSFFQWIDSWYATFSNIFSSIISFAGNLAAAGGLCLAGICLVIKKENLQLMKIAPFLIIGYCACSFITNFIYLVSWDSGTYVFNMLFNIVLALLWAALAMLTFGYKPDFTKKISIAYIIVPAVLLAIHFLMNISIYSFNFARLLAVIIEYTALIIVGVMIYMDSIGAADHNNCENDDSSATSDHTQHEQTPDTNSASAHIAAEPEGYTGVVKLVLLSIVTFGIYVYIWIYRVAGYTGKRSVQGPQCSQGVQVVLCLFVPFYFIYWIYKQCKAIEDIRTRTIGAGSEDLSLICLLLSIFGFGIVAYALMQDQINKIVVPMPAYNHFYPGAEQPAAEETVKTESFHENSSTITDAQIETVKKLKALLDAGILTQEEFDAKKKQVLGL